MEAYYFSTPQVYYFLVPHLACERTDSRDTGALCSVGSVSAIHSRLSDAANWPHPLTGWFGFFSTIRKKKAPACINVFYKSQLLESTKCYFVVCFREILVICFCNLHKSILYNIFEGSEEMTGTFQGNQSHKIKIVQLQSFQSIFPERHDRTFPWYDI